MITSLRVNGWKSYGSSILNIDALSVIIGTNASGKSNLLEAFTFLNRTASGMILTTALQGDGIVPPMRGGVEWAAKRPGTSFTLSITFRYDALTDLEYSIECRTDGKRCELSSEQLERIKYRSAKGGGRGSPSGKIFLFKTDIAENDTPTLIARLYNGKRGTPRFIGRANSALFQLSGQKTPAEVHEGIEKVIDAMRQIFILDPIPSHMRNFSPLSDRLDGDAGNIAGVLAALADEEKKQVQKILIKYASQLPERDIVDVYAEPVGKFGNDAMLYAEELIGSSSSQIVDARGMSDGTLRFLAILTSLLTRPGGSLLVVEEVDNGLHPSRSELLLAMLKELGSERVVDVIVTTHNPALLDAMGPSMVPFITVAHRDPESGDSVLTLLEEIDDLPKLLARGPVGQASSKGLIEEALAAEAL